MYVFSIFWWTVFILKYCIHIIDWYKSPLRHYHIAVMTFWVVESAPIILNRERTRITLPSTTPVALWEIRKIDCLLVLESNHLLWNLLVLRLAFFHCDVNCMKWFITRSAYMKFDQSMMIISNVMKYKHAFHFVGKVQNSHRMKMDYVVFFKLLLSNKH